MSQTKESIQAKIVEKLACPRDTDKGFLCNGCYRSDGIPLVTTKAIAFWLLGITPGPGPTLPCERMNRTIPTLGPLIDVYKKIG